MPKTFGWLTARRRQRQCGRVRCQEAALHLRRLLADRRRPRTAASWLRNAKDPGLPSVSFGAKRAAGMGRDDEFVHGRTGHSTRSLAAHRQIAVDTASSWGTADAGADGRPKSGYGARRPSAAKYGPQSVWNGHSAYRESRPPRMQRVLVRVASCRSTCGTRSRKHVCGGRQPRPLASSDRMPVCSDGWGS